MITLSFIKSFYLNDNDNDNENDNGRFVPRIVNESLKPCFSLLSIYLLSLSRQGYVICFVCGENPQLYPLGNVKK